MDNSRFYVFLMIVIEYLDEFKYRTFSKELDDLSHMIEAFKQDLDKRKVS